MKASRLIWGIALLLLGVLLLGSNFGWWDSSSLYRLVDLWPILLVILGVVIVFGNSNPISIILLLIVFIFGFLYVINYKNIGERIGIEKTVQEETQNFSYERGNITNAKINLELGAANIEVEATEEQTGLYSGTFESGTQIGEEIKTDSSGNADVTISEKIKNFKFNRNSKRDFYLSLNPAIKYDLKVDSGASKLNLNLIRVQVKNLEINTGATSGEISLGTMVDKVNVKINTGASKTTIYIPNSFALVIKSDSALLSHNFKELGLIKEDKTYKSSDAASNSKLIEIDISSGASTINVERY